MRLIVPLLLAAAAFGQIPSDVLRSQVATRLSYEAQYLADHPNAKVWKRLEEAIHFTNEDGTRTAVCRRGLSHVDPDTNDIVPTELNLHQTDLGYRTVGSPVVVRVIDGPLMNGNPTSEVDTYYRDPADKSVTGYGIVAAPMTWDRDTVFRFRQAGLTWELELQEMGWDLRAQVAAAQGAKTYTFGYREVGMTLQEDAATGDLAIFSGRYRITRPIMMRADGITIPCSAWSRDPSKISFTCDDTGFPAEAYPYLIDPTASYYVTAGGDDATISAQLYTTNSSWNCSTIGWPPGSANGVTNNDTNPWAGNQRYWSGGSYYYCNEWEGLFRFDTSAIPSSAMITAASLNLYVTAVQNTESQNLVGDYVSNALWPITTSAYSNSLSGTAFTKALSTFTGSAYNTIALAAVANVQKAAGAYTALRFGNLTAPTYVGTTASANRISYSTFDTGSNKPYLLVTYTVSGPKLIVVSQ